MKVTISKATSEGEALSVVVDLKDASEYDKKVAPALLRLDERLLEINMRLVKAHRVLDHFPRKYHAALRVVFDALHGCRTDALSNVPQLIRDAELSEEAKAITEAARAQGQLRDPEPVEVEPTDAPS